MKTLEKLEINPERLMKDEELTVLRGGAQHSCSVDCDDYHETIFTFSSTCYAWDYWCAADECAWFFSQAFTNCRCTCPVGYA